MDTQLLTGRQQLITDLQSIDSEEVMLDELERILPYFLTNQMEISFLTEYYKGYHPAINNRVKKVRPEINNKITVNYAWSATRDIVGYFLGKPIQYVHQKTDDNITESIAAFNRILDAENKNLINMEIADDQSICGIGYLGIFVDTVRKNGTSLKLKRLDPVTTFVVHSSSPDVEELYACSFYTQQYDIRSAQTPKTVYTVWTKNARFTITGDAPNGFTAASSEIVRSNFSYGGYLPIQEYPNNMFRIGDWEPALSIMDAIDSGASNRINDIDQTVQAILVALGIDLSGDGVLDQLQDAGILNIPAVAEGAMKPYVDYVKSPLDPSVGTTVSSYLEACMNVVVGIPDRKTRGGVGGDTGAAVELRDGWVDIDLVASFKEPFFIKADRNSLGAILYLLNANKDFSGLAVEDIEIKFSRNKTANIQVKSQALSTLLAAGIHPQDALEWCDLTTDVLSVVQRMLEQQQYNNERAAALVERQQKMTEDSDDKSEEQPENSKEKS